MMITVSRNRKNYVHLTITTAEMIVESYEIEKERQQTHGIHFCISLYIP